MIGISHKQIYTEDLLNKDSDIDFVEIITENFINNDDFSLLQRLSEKYKMSAHGVSLNLASEQELNKDYLNKLKRLLDAVPFEMVSDHLCWTGNAHGNSHALIPFIYNEESLNRTALKIHEVQKFLKRPIALENLSAYIRFKGSTMTEAEFLTKLVEMTGCKILLDVNNLVVDERNFNTSLEEYISTIPMDSIAEIHLAGYYDKGDFYLDTHSEPVAPRTWEIYKSVIQKAGRNIPTNLERDSDLPEFSELVREIHLAKTLMEKNNVSR